MKNLPADYKTLAKTLDTLGSPERAKSSVWYFKTGPGQYGAGDKFIGITVPIQRKVARQFKNLNFSELKKLIKSPIHEYRFVALEILVFKYEEGSTENKEKIIRFYLANTKYINNWDLVDTSAPYILGNYLSNKNKDILYKLAKSKNIWERRIAIVATSVFIQSGNYKETLKISEMLLNDKHDLIHKAVGWMLREVGKKSIKTETTFLDKFYKIMPRTMLRYAIEKFTDGKRKHYMRKS